MSDPTEVDAAPALRGEAAYNQHLEEVAKRNAAASKDAKARRQHYEQAQVAKDRKREAAEMARFMAASPNA